MKKIALQEILRRGQTAARLVVMPKNENFFDAGFEAAFEKVRKRYVRSLPGRLVELESAYETAQTSEGMSQDGSGLAEVTHIAHELSGSAPFFGLSSIGEAARDLEKACTSIDGELFPRAEPWREIADLVVRLRARWKAYPIRPGMGLKGQSGKFSPPVGDQSRFCWRKTTWIRRSS